METEKMNYIVVVESESEGAFIDGLYKTEEEAIKEGCSWGKYDFTVQEVSCETGQPYRFTTYTVWNFGNKYKQIDCGWGNKIFNKK